MELDLTFSTIVLCADLFLIVDGMKKEARGKQRRASQAKEGNGVSLCTVPVFKASQVLAEQSSPDP